MLHFPLKYSGVEGKAEDGNTQNISELYIYWLNVLSYIAPLCTPAHV